MEFEKIYRQTNLEFIELLNCVRNRSVTPKHLEKLNSRCKENISDIMDGYIYLTTINKQADEINLVNIEKLTTKAYYYEAEISGGFGESYYPSDKKLALKVGGKNNVFK